VITFDFAHFGPLVSRPEPRAPRAEASLVSGAGAISAIEKALRWSSSVALLAGCHGLRGAGGFTHGSGRERAEHVFSR
jgi:hypothetical protein